MQSEAEWVITNFEKRKQFSWESRRPGLHMIATHEIYPEEGGARNVLRAEIKGVLAVLLWPLLRLAIPKALKNENHGLKNRCEEMAKTPCQKQNNTYFSAGTFNYEIVHLRTLVFKIEQITSFLTALKMI